MSTTTSSPRKSSKAKPRSPASVKGGGMGADGAAASGVQHQEYTIDELARVAGSTVRNVRAYQDRGLLEPPLLRGRTGVYSSGHAMRLKLINHLLSRGYTLANIQELVRVLVEGQSLHDILGLQKAISSPWSNEVPRNFSLPELMKLVGIPFSPKLLKKCIDLGLLEPDGLGYRAPSPRMIIAGGELAKAGIPLEDTLNIVEQLRNNVEMVADAMLKQILPLLDRAGAGRIPPKDELPKIANLIWRLRPLAMMAVESEVSRALERASTKFLGERVEQILELMQKAQAEAAGEAN